MFLFSEQASHYNYVLYVYNNFCMDSKQKGKACQAHRLNESKRPTDNVSIKMGFHDRQTAYRQYK